MIALPFNHQPVSTVVKTGSYSIPATNYARVTVIDTLADFTIDGVIADPTTILDSSFADNLTGSVVYTNSTQDILLGNISIPSSSSVWTIRIADPVDLTQAATHLYTGVTQEYSAITGLSLNVSILPGQVVYQVKSGLDEGISANLIWAAQNALAAKVFWVPAGTALIGTKYVVELYNELS